MRRSAVFTRVSETSHLEPALWMSAVYQIALGRLRATYDGAVPAAVWDGRMNQR
jgi:hypothetical protein